MLGVDQIVFKIESSDKISNSSLVVGLLPLLT